MPHAPAMTEASPGNESVMKCDEEGKKKKKARGFHKEGTVERKSCS